MQMVVMVLNFRALEAGWTRPVSGKLGSTFYRSLAVWSFVAVGHWFVCWLNIQTMAIGALLG